MKALLITLLVGLFILVGAILGNILKNNKKFIDISIGLALGVMILLLILDIIPEAYELLSDSIDYKLVTIAILLISGLVGFLGLKLLDSFVPHHEHESLHHHNHKNDKCHNEHLEHVGILASIAVIIHNIIEGMTLYVTTIQDFKSGILLCIAIGLHNIPLGIIISTTLQSKKEIIINSIVLSLSTFVGGLMVFFVSDIVSNGLVGILLSITFGMLSYIIILELLPQIIYNKNKKYNIFGIVLGVLIIIISSLLG